jgi:hypothetical protein
MNRASKSRSSSRGRPCSSIPKIYEKCDAFFVDFGESSEEGGLDTKIRVELHALVEKLLHYNKPIIANSLMSWNALELVV